MLDGESPLNVVKKYTHKRKILSTSGSIVRDCCEIKFFHVPFEKCSLLEGGNCCSPAVGCFDLHLPEKSFHPVKIQTPGQLR